MSRVERSPVESVDILAAPIIVDDREERLAASRRLFLAATIFGALCWVGTLVTAVVSSETNGMRASWIAIIPSAFGLMGLVQVSRGVFGRRAVAVSFFLAIGAVVGLFVFFEGIWPSL